MTITKIQKFSSMKRIGYKHWESNNFTYFLVSPSDTDIHLKVLYFCFYFLIILFIISINGYLTYCPGICPDYTKCYNPFILGDTEANESHSLMSVLCQLGSKRSNCCSESELNVNHQEEFPGLVSRWYKWERWNIFFPREKSLARWRRNNSIYFVFPEYGVLFKNSCTRAVLFCLSFRDVVWPDGMSGVPQSCSMTLLLSWSEERKYKGSLMSWG